MGFRERVITLDFDDLGEGMFVKMRNPQLVPVDQLSPADIELDANGQPKDRKKAQAASNAILAGLIVDWLMYDALSEEDVALPLPTTADPSPLNRVPAYVLTRLGNEIGERVNPK